GGGRGDAALRRRLSPRAARRAHARRSRRRRQGRPHPSGRGAVLPRARRRGAKGGVTSRTAPSESLVVSTSELFDRTTHGRRRLRGDNDTVRPYGRNEE